MQPGALPFNTMLLSPEDQDLLNYSIKMNNSGYWYITSQFDKTSWTEAIHRIVMRRLLLIELPKHLVVDHINKNKEDNRRNNLRFLSPSDNLLRANWKTGVSKYRRVSLDRSTNKWAVKIQVDKRTHYFGQWADIEHAAFMSDVWTYRIQTEHAALNFPERLEEIKQEALKLDAPNWEWRRNPYADFSG